jgi:hypothetical protein
MPGTITTLPSQYQHRPTPSNARHGHSVLRLQGWALLRCKVNYFKNYSLIQGIYRLSFVDQDSFLRPCKHGGLKNLSQDSGNQS